MNHTITLTTQQVLAVLMVLAEAEPDKVLLPAADRSYQRGTRKLMDCLVVAGNAADLEWED